MRADLLMTAVQNRSADLRAIILPFVLAHTGVIVAIVFGGSGLEGDGVQLAVAAWAVLGSLWATIWTDGCIQDLAAGAKDLDDELANSNIGRAYARAPFPVFRIMNVTVVVLIVSAELLAIY